MHSFVKDVGRLGLRPGEANLCNKMPKICPDGCYNHQSVLTAKAVKGPKNITITDHFTDLIQHGDVNGDHAAIVGDNGPLYTSMELDMTANRYAKAIRSLLGYWTSSNSDGDLVIAFCLHTTEDAVLAMLSILKLGGTYLALSTLYPEQQIVRIVGMTRPLLIITESESPIISKFDCVKHICEIVSIDVVKEVSKNFGDPNDPVPLESLLAPWKRTACVVLTPGTTGEPRFVRIGHLAILNRLYWQFKWIPYTEDEKVVCLSSLLVDVESVGEIFASLLGGKPLYIVHRHFMTKSSSLLEKIEQIQISRITLTPSTLSNALHVLETMEPDTVQKTMKSLRYLIVSGDVMSLQLGLKCFQFMNESCRLLYVYGATETTSEATWELFDDVKDFKCKMCKGRQISIGRPLSDCTVYIMDEDNNIVPEGVTGEICIGGKCLAIGYTNNRDLYLSFIQYPKRAKKSHQVKIFRTGDLGKIETSDGTRERLLYYEGRLDMIMKNDGYDIELSKVAAAVEATDLVEECTVLCYHRNREDQAAVAFVVLKEGVTKEILIISLRNVLEHYMMPDIYPVQTLPYLPSGKLDRQKLLKTYKFRRMESSPEDWDALGLGIYEKRAAKVLLESISHTIGISLRFVMSQFRASFWSIGGNSLNALAVVYTCRENGYLISVDDFVTAETISMIVKCMAMSSKQPVKQSQMLVNISDDLPTWKYVINDMTDECKVRVTELMSKSYAEKSVVAITAGILQDSYLKHLQLMWDDVIKRNLSIFASEKNTGKIVGAAICFDVNDKPSLSKLKRHGDKLMQYYFELWGACESIVRHTTISREKGKVLEILMLAVDMSLPPKNKIMLAEFLIKGSLQQGLQKGFSWVLIATTSPLIRDLCGNILLFDLIAEVKLNTFVAKDKTKPFKKARDYQAMRAYYQLFS